MNRPKAHKLPISTRQAIGRWKANHPEISLPELAYKYKCTVPQARKAVDDYKTGKLTQERPPKKDVSKIIRDNSPDDLFEKQYRMALAQLEVDDAMSSGERIVMLEKLANINKSLQQVRLQNHLKRADSEVIARIIRRFEPEADESRIIAIYREEMEKWKNSL